MLRSETGTPTADRYEIAFQAIPAAEVPIRWRVKIVRQAAERGMGPVALSRTGLRRS